MILKFHTFPPSMQNFSSDTLKNLREIPFLMLFNASPMFSQLKTSVALYFNNQSTVNQSCLGFLLKHILHTFQTNKITTKTTNKKNAKTSNKKYCAQLRWWTTGLMLIFWGCLRRYSSHQIALSRGCWGWSMMRSLNCETESW